MKKLLTLLMLSGFMFWFASCDDDDEIVDLDDPEITTPATQNMEVGESVTLTFNVTTDAGFASAEVDASMGTATITSEPDAGATTGDVVVNYTSNVTGAALITLLVTDNEGDMEDVTAAVNVGDVVTAPEIDVNFDIEEDEVWTTGNIYILRGRIAVTNDATLTIQPGVIIKGDEGTGSNATALLVARDGTLNAQGTAEQPIIFTSIQDAIQPGQMESPNLEPNIPGLWGGVLILGSAPISAQNAANEDVSETAIEGIPSSDANGLYGGDQPDDNSGTIKYISIRHGGTNIGQGNEINGLTLGGVGSGTTIENVEVVANNDDGIEWFGGNVDVTNALIWNSVDDALDSDMDWNGTMDNFLIVSPGGSAFELDGPEGSQKREYHLFTNGTVYAGSGISQLVDWDGNTNAALQDIYFYGWDADYGVLEDNPATTDEDESFSPIGSFGGDKSGATTGWEYTLPANGRPVAEVFNDVPSEILTSVNANANTVGADVSAFSWTWASESGALTAIGL